MFRPFYALIILLEALAGSLLLVRSASSQTILPETGRLPAILVFAWTIDEEFDDPCVDCPGVSDLECGNLSSGLETDCLPIWPDVPNQGASTTLLETGYDGDYDSAMFGADPFEQAANDVGMGNSCDDDQNVPDPSALVVHGPTTSVCFDFDGRLGCTYLPAMDCFRNARFGEVSGVVVVGPEAEGWVEAPASSGEPDLTAEESEAACQAVLGAWVRAGETAHHVWTRPWNFLAPQPATVDTRLRAADARAALQALDVAVHRIGHIAELLWNGAWSPVTQHSLLAGRSAAADLQTTMHYVYIVLPDQVERYREEATLIQAANTLDQLGLQMQQAAQQLRSWAVERIAEKHSSRRVAQRGR
jgi:hypothetical protein